MRNSIYLDHYLYNAFPDIKTKPYTDMFIHETRVAYLHPNTRPQFLIFRLSNRFDLKTFVFSFYLVDQEQGANVNKTTPRYKMGSLRYSMYELYSRNWEREHGKDVVANYEDKNGVLIDPEKIGGVARDLECFKKHLMFLLLVETTCYLIERNNKPIQDISVTDKNEIYHELLAMFKDICNDVDSFTPVRVRKSLSELILMNEKIIDVNWKNPSFGYRIGQIQFEETFDVKDSSTWSTNIELTGLEFPLTLPVTMRVDFKEDSFIILFKVNFGNSVGELKSYCSVKIQMRNESKDFNFDLFFLETLKNFMKKFNSWQYEDFNINGYKENLDTFELLRRSIPYNENIITV